MCDWGSQGGGGILMQIVTEPEMRGSPPTSRPSLSLLEPNVKAMSLSYFPFCIFLQILFSPSQTQFILLPWLFAIIFNPLVKKPAC